MKGITLQDLSSLSIVFIVVAIFLGIGATILSQIQTTQYVDIAYTNETITFAVNNTYYPFTNTPVVDVGHVWAYPNESTFEYAEGTTVPSYAHNTTHIRLYTNGTGNWPNYTAADHYVDYTWTNQLTSAANATGYGLTGTGTMSQWLPIIAVIIASAIVIGIIIKSFS